MLERISPRFRVEERRSLQARRGCDSFIRVAHFRRSATVPLRYPAERILIRCPNWIGDMIAATAALRCMRSNYPGAHIALLLKPYVRPVIAHAPWADEVIEADPRGGLAGLLATAKRLRRLPRAVSGAGRPYDLALLLTQSFNSALMVWLARAKRRVGHAREGRSFLLTDAVPWPGRGFSNPRLVPKVLVYSSLLEYLGCARAADRRPEVFTSPEDEAQADELLAARGRETGRPLLAIVPGAAYGASKLWPPERFAGVADALAASRGLQAVLLTGPSEERIGEEIAQAMKSRPISFREGEVSFGALKAIVRRSALMICNDTGPRHLAIAYDVPVVVLMGPTSPVVTDSDYPRTAILRQDVPCAPCYLRRCPTDHRCMRLITPAMVLAAAETLLDKARAPAS
jgi:heptosyltransferase-2